MQHVTLKKLFTRIASDELEPEKSKRVIFTVTYSKQGRHTGCAYLKGIHGTLRLPKPPHAIDNTKVAMVIAHEMAYLRGVEHGANMHCARYSWTHGDYKTFYAWANEYPIGVREPKPKPVVAPVDAKLDHATKMLAKNEAKLKRTAALVKKWTAKVKYYQKRTEVKTCPTAV
jgi:hypothetical protein